MAGSTKVENRFGQVLICLRMSKLDFVVKETPYSAYVTIRKKFVKAIKDDMIEENSPVNKDAVDQLDKFRRENILQSKMVDLEKECAVLRFEKEELEIKADAMEKDKISLEDDIEDALAESRKLRKNTEKISAENTSIKRHLDAVIKDKDDTISILEFTIESKKEEIKNLQAKENLQIDDNSDLDSDSDSQKASTSSKVVCDSCTSGVKNVEEHEQKVHVFSCEVCSFKAKKTEELRKHNLENHMFNCDHCEYTAESIDSLDLHLEETHKYRCNLCKLTHNDEWKHTIHICRERIDNPTYKSYYTKAWLNRNGCNAIYCSQRNEDVIWLHDHKCWSGEVCCHWTPHVYFGDPIEPGSVKHLHYPEFVKNSKIIWPAICEEL